MSDPIRPTTETQAWPGHAAAEHYETPMYGVGKKGVNLQDALADLAPEELSRMVNMVSRYGEALTTRLGQTAVGSTQQGYLHRLFRINDQQDSSFARLAGLGATLWRGTTGAFTLIDSNYSSDPLTFTAVNMPKGQTPYVLVTDRMRMRKVTRTGSVEEIGIRPAAQPVVSLIGQSLKTIATFTTSDGTDAAQWTATAGQDRSASPVASGVPILTDVLAGAAVQMETVVGSAATGYDSIMSIAKVLDLDYLAPGIKASDDDHIRLQFNVSDPGVLEELKIYLVCSPTFTPGAIPGNGTGNDQAWFKSFRPNDLQAYVTREESGLAASQALQQRALLEQFKTDQTTDDRASLTNLTGALVLPRTAIPMIAAGKNVWAILGEPGSPLRREEWQRIGQDLDTPSGRGWNTIVGIVIVVQTSTNEPITLQFSQWWLYGGSGPDNSDPGASPYDVRVRNIHSLTGSKGNPCAVMPETAWVNALRQTISVVPQAYGDANIRQQAFLRGGSAVGTTDWFFAGENTTDGGTILITASDNERITEESLEIDNDQPVTSTDPFGGTVLAQIVPVMFQIGEYTFALGDPNQPGRLYRSKRRAPEQWPADDYNDISPAADPLMNGGAWTTGGFVFSQQRMFAILIDAEGNWTAEPTACAEGLVGRWAFAVTPYGIAFVSPYGVRLTQGGAPDMISDEQLGKIFRGESVNGFLPVDYTTRQAPQLEYADDELWLTYADSSGARRQWVYSFKERTWRNYLFGQQVGTVYNEPVSGQPGSILLGGSGSGGVYAHSGFSDAGTAIAYTARTGAWDFGTPRNEKSFSAVIVDGDLQGAAFTMQAFLNDEVVERTALAVTGLSAMARYLFEPFGTAPARGHNVSVEIRGNASTSSRPQFEALGVTQRQEPEITFNEASPWEELVGGEGYAYGVILTCDTGGQDRTILIEGTVNNGAITTLATLIVNANGRKKLPFSFPSTLVQQIRFRPIGDCLPWIRWKVEWISDPEPVRIPGWDTNWEAFGTFADKWIKGYLIEADTFGATKTVVLDVATLAGAQLLAQDTLTLTLSGRGVYQHSFPKIRGRLFRLRATDPAYGKFYRWQPIFDEEPLALTRWETQERPFPGMDGKWQKPLEALLTIRSSADVSWQLTSAGFSGASLNVSTYTIPSTGGAKQKVRVPLNAAKGLLFTHLFTSAAAFWLYKEESEIQIEDWTSGQAAWIPMWGANDDRDPARQMGNSASAAATPTRG